jgi:hypothetical protein
MAADGIVRSFTVSRPADALITFSVSFAVIASVPMSPYSHCWILCLTFNVPLIVTASYSSPAPSSYDMTFIFLVVVFSSLVSIRLSYYKN